MTSEWRSISARNRLGVYHGGRTSVLSSSRCPVSRARARALAAVGNPGGTARRTGAAQAQEGTRAKWFYDGMLLLFASLLTLLADGDLHRGLLVGSCDGLRSAVPFQPAYAAYHEQ